MRTALTLAGSESGGGAGIQADLKTFAAHGVFGTSAITAITAQNTVRVTAWEPVSAALVSAQIDAVAADIGADAVKTGMLANAEIVQAVVSALGRLRLPHLVVDPVMIAKGGDRLLKEAAVAAIRDQLLPLAEVVTPNIPEAEVLSGLSITNLDDMRRAAQRILTMGPRVVLVKGGHLETDDSIDIACASDGCEEFRSARIASVHTHGTGCTLASAIAANLCLGHAPSEACRRAADYVADALRLGSQPGRGSVTVLDHFGAASARE